MQLNDLLKVALESGASDLHLKVGTSPLIRLRGALVPASQERRLEHEDMVAMAAAVLPVSKREAFNQHHEVDLAYSVRFGWGLESRLRALLHADHDGELPVGHAVIVETGDARLDGVDGFRVDVIGLMMKDLLTVQNQ